MPEQSSCPDAFELAEFHEGRIDGPAARRIEEHVEACAACRDELAELALDHRFAAELCERIPDGPADPEPCGPEPEAIAELLRESTQGERYEVLGELGRGGMGIVYEVRDRVLRRTLAMKVAGVAGDEPGTAASPTGRRLARFLEEVRITGQLDHPSIIPVHELSVDAHGRAFFTMRKVRGENLHEVLEAFEAGEGDWTLQRLVVVLLRACDALAYAHSMRVVHRDLKPANIMVGRFGAVYVMDWGVAKVVPRNEGVPASASGVRPSSSLTQTRLWSVRGPGESQPESTSPIMTLDGEVLGTPSYMAPEQATGLMEQVDARSDVYAMGAILYRLLSGRTPYDDCSDSRQVWRRLLDGPPVPLGEVAPKSPPELVAICERAMARKKAARYSDMAGLAADLRAWLAGRVVRAHKTGVLAEARKWIGRNRASACAGLIAVTVVSGVLVRQSIVEAGRRAEAAQLQRKNAIRNGVALARVRAFHDAETALMPLERQSSEPALRAALDELFCRFPCLASYPLTREPDEVVVRATFGPEGEWLLTTHERQDAPEEERFHVQLWRVPLPGEAVSSERWESVWRSPPCELIADAEHVRPGHVVAWMTGERTVAVGGPRREVASFECADRIVMLLPVGVRDRFAVGFTDHVQVRGADGELLDTMELAVDVNVARPTVVGGKPFLVNGNADGIWTISSPDPDTDVIELGGRFPMIYHDPTDPARIVVTTDARISSCRSEDGRLALEAMREHFLPRRIEQTRLQESDVELERAFAYLVKMQRWTSNLVLGRFFAPGDDRPEPYIVAVEDRVLRVWGRAEPQPIDPQGQGLEAASFDPDGNRLWCGGFDTLAAWSFREGRLGARKNVPLPREVRRAVAREMQPSFSGFAFDPGGAAFVCVRGDVHQRGEPGWIFVLPTDGQSGASYACREEPGWIELDPERARLAVAGRKGGVELWAYDRGLRVLTDRASLPALGDEPRLTCVRFLGPRFLLASSVGGSGLLLWDTSQRSTPPVSVAPFVARRTLRCLDVSRDGRFVATGGDDQLLRVLRVVWREGRPTLETVWKEDHGASVFAVAFTERDGALVLASADRLGGIRLWDGETGAERGTVRDALETVDEMVLSLDFTPDGRYLAASKSLGRVLLWDMDRSRRCLERNRDCAEHVERLLAK
ncbi:MAG: protein kinase [bacterium]|nr:protein kinase [bacterium]